MKIKIMAFKELPEISEDTLDKKTHLGKFTVLRSNRILFFPEMRVTKKIFTQAATRKFF